MADIISVRQHEILKLFLENQTGLTIDEIINSVGISRAGVMQHFLALENQGYIQKKSLNKTSGRPVTNYGITRKGINYFPKQYAWFSELMLGNLQDELGPERFNAYMHKLGVTVADGLKGRFIGKSIEKRIDELTAVMTELGYEVNTQYSGTSKHFKIRAHNCVYHDLAQKHNEICQFDLALMSTLLNQEVELLTCMAKGDCACNFRVKKPSGATAEFLGSGT
jgi:DeoR family transcriptional regulator, suf operon transcriptional repressor